MSTILSAQDVRFRSAWLDLSLLRWELLAPSWRSRYEYLVAQEEVSHYEKDWLFFLARDFLSLQGVAHFSDEAWSEYRSSEYKGIALRGGHVWPSPSEAVSALTGLVSALEETLKRARAAQPLDKSTLHRLVEKFLGRPAALRKEALNGPIPQKVVSPNDVEAALSTLLEDIQSQTAAGVSPIWVAAWAHHALTQIRPYADGNARAALLVSQYVLWRAGLPGFVLKPFQRIPYYTALQAADSGDLRPWAQLFLEGLQQATLYALSWGYAGKRSYEESISAFNRRFSGWRSRHDRDRSQRIMNNRYTVFDYMEEILRQVANELDEKLKVEEGRGTRALVAKAYPDSPYYYQFTTDIVEYARKNGYYLNRGLPRGWFKIKFSLSASKKYQLVFSLHHAGHDDATLAVGALLHFLEPLKYRRRRLRQRKNRREKVVYLFAPLSFSTSPLTFSIENVSPSVRTLLREYVQQNLEKALIELVNEIY
ncbi:MAG: Fic family protein [Bacteroidia bacterium]|nr:Fic family protein [Bacteroidia bacterium]MDW8134804.1 Fic family protein [Bacteroidia bacterium]